MTRPSDTWYAQTAILWVVLAGLSCVLGKSASANIATQDLIGTWEWVHTTLPWDGGQQTPESEGYTQTLLLRGDGTYSLLRDAVEISVGSWTLSETAPPCSSPPSLTVDHFYGGQPMDLYFNNDYLTSGLDYLTFGLLCIDLSNHTFTRPTSVSTSASSWSTIKAGFRSSK